MSAHDRWLRDPSRSPAAAATFSRVVRRVRDPVRDITALSEAMLDNPGRKRPRLPASIRARYGQPQQMRVDAEPCCVTTIKALERNMQHLQLPHEFTCTCGVVWSFEMALTGGPS